ncbi:MAG: O-antigen ligase family protein [Candidatus Peribacteria bacterium]|nr:O-antigen ligase family protein [Candidatus Peribacteria bacterium]
MLSTRSRGAIAFFGLEILAIALFLHRNFLKKRIWLLILLGGASIGGVAFLGQRFFAREHSNTGHLVLIQEGRNIVKPHLITGW